MLHRLSIYSELCEPQANYALLKIAQRNLSFTVSFANYSLKFKTSRTASTRHLLQFNITTDTSFPELQVDTLAKKKLKTSYQNWAKCVKHLKLVQYVKQNYKHIHIMQIYFCTQMYEAFMLHGELMKWNFPSFCNFRARQPLSDGWFRVPLEIHSISVSFNPI